MAECNRGKSEEIKEKVTSVSSDIERGSPEHGFARAQPKKGNVGKRNNSRKEELFPEKSQEPLDDFRQLSVYPSAVEILRDKNLLRPNIIKGPYKNVDHYLDIQFRLLRENFIRPLRNNIQKYCNSNITENINVYKKVKFLKPEPVNERNCFRFLVYPNKKGKVPDSESSRRIKNGSLVCFTQDTFITVVFGKISQKNTAALEKGELVVEFDEKFPIVLNVPYVMIDCKIQFETYFQVLTALKNLSETNFPIKEYIVYLKMDIQPPKYLPESECMYTVEGNKFSILHTWPSRKFYNLDQSQMLAFRAALTQELAVIQGPPGTGKTYLGVLIVKTLLENQKWWHKRSPILVLCCSNYALDHFLEGLLSYTEDIIRIGGQWSNPKLNKFNLRSLSRTKNTSVWEKLKLLEKLEAGIKEVTDLLKEADSYRNIIDFKHFDEVTSRTWFYHASSNALLQWLLSGYESMMQLETDAEMPGYKHIDDSYKNLNKTALITLESLFGDIKTLEKSFKSRKSDSQVEIKNKLVTLIHKYNYLSMRLEEGQKNQANATGLPKNADLVNPKIMDYNDRWKLYFHWLHLYKTKLTQKLDSLIHDYQEMYKEYDKLHSYEITKILQKTLIVGLTVNNAARYRLSLQSLKCPIVIVEEAAEILEAYIVSALTEHCQHLILLGDHQQLGPRTAADKFNLGISLFERFILNSGQYSVLCTQHRMREEIAALILPIYPFLKTDSSIPDRVPIINGVDKSVFFIHHNNKETDDEGGTKINRHEILFFIHFTKYLLCNGYSPNNITILTPYAGQIREFQKELLKHDDLKDLRVSLLDSYQGEENDIILLSLVRNNTNYDIGFLSNENRICVALSRAKSGFYIMGNINQFSKASDLWRKVEAVLYEQEAIGPKLVLRCQIHPDVLTYVKSDTDFINIPDGGCTRICGKTLKCGHTCNLVCHLQDKDHNDYQCQEECTRLLCDEKDTHRCMKRCYEKCGPCNYLTEKNLSCGHKVVIKCHLKPEQTYIKCPVTVIVELNCGHHVEKLCSDDIKLIKCFQPCNKVLSCGHSCGLLCHTQTDPDHLEYKCRKRCTRYLQDCTTHDELHKCRKMCYEECDQCTFPVRKQKSSCGHIFEVFCYVNIDDIACKERCSKMLDCGHQCTKTCGEKCGSCKTQVVKAYPVCGHPVKVKCLEKPDRLNCNKKCPLKLTCGHPCCAKCNEPCTTNCITLVDCSMMAECGHMVTKVKCNIFQNSSFAQENSKLPWKFCNKPCETILACGHLCSGSCSECFQGRFHKKCVEKCAVTLICNHQHEFICKEANNPCPSKCFYKCPHNSCSKKCSEICSPCKKKCPRSCIHQQCTLTCGDICNINPCQKPCQKVLKCEHNCTGFCGEPCPPLCMICDEKVLEESYDVRYIYLNDCKHSIKETEMEEWVESYKDHFLDLITCPKCKTPVVTTLRYTNLVKRTLKDIAEIKALLSGTVKDNEEKCQELRCNFFKLKQKIAPLHSSLPKLKSALEAFEMQFKNCTKTKQKPVLKYHLETLTSKLDVVDFVTETCSDDINIDKYLVSHVNFILNMIKHEEVLTEQQIEDIYMELNRFLRAHQYYQIKTYKNMQAVNINEVQRVENEIKKYILHFERFTTEQDQEIKKLLKTLNTLIGSDSNLAEVNAVKLFSFAGFQKTNWTKRKNGQICTLNNSEHN